MRSSTPSSPLHLTLPARLRAFTLIELLVVIAIIAVLASILIPVMASVRARGDAAKCASNLRVIGTAINSFAGDHDGRLPGPLEPMVYPPNATAQTRDTGSLVAFIGEYLGAKQRSTTGSSGDHVVKCPAFTRKAGNDDTLPPYVLNFADKLEQLENQPPWGNVQGDVQPAKMVTLTDWENTENDPRDVTPNGLRNLSQTWAVKDADKEGFIDMQQPSIASSLPDMPVHEEYRNALFYDWHVGKLDLEDRPK